MVINENNEIWLTKVVIFGYSKVFQWNNSMRNNMGFTVVIEKLKKVEIPIYKSGIFKYRSRNNTTLE